MAEKQAGIGLRQVEHELLELRLHVVVHRRADDDRAVRDQRRLPELDQVVHVEDALVDHLLQIARGVAVLEFADARTEGRAGIERALDDFENQVFVTAAEAGFTEEFLDRRADRLPAG